MKASFPFGRRRAPLLLTLGAGALFWACGPQPLTNELGDDFASTGGSSGYGAAGHPGTGGTTSAGGSAGISATGGTAGHVGTTTGGSGGTSTGGTAGTLGTAGHLGTGGSAGTFASTGGSSGTSSTFGGAGHGGMSFGGSGGTTAFGAGGAATFGGNGGATTMFGGAGRGGRAGSGGASMGGTTGSGGASSFSAVAAIFNSQCGTSACHGGRQSPNLTSSNLTTLYSTLTNTTVRQCGSDHLVTKSDTANSAVLELVQHQCSNFVMPQGCTQNPCLSSADMTTLTSWIQAGAPGP